MNTLQTSIASYRARFYLLAATFLAWCLFPVLNYAQGTRGGLQAVGTTLTTYETTTQGWVQPVTNMCYFAAVGLFVMGLVKLVSKFNSKEQDTMSSAGYWIGGAIIAAVVPSILTTWLGVTVN